MLSNDKVNLFNDRLIDLLEYLLVSDYNKTEEKAQYASFVMDYIVTNEALDYKLDPDINLVTIF